MPAAITLADPDPAWAVAYSREAVKVTTALGDVLIALHHIGSTSIPGIRAKPVIDMLAVVTDVMQLDTVSDALVRLGYEAKGEFGIPGRRYFRKDSAAGVRTHQIHAFAEGSIEITRHLDFRDYLRAHRDAALQYEILKRDLAANVGGNMEAYSNGKTAFIRDIEARAATSRRLTT
jgi:GrpB-like predicted nucleotidyltransferase (UPF0157 family)